jgi:hypothetical protein
MMRIAGSLALVAVLAAGAGQGVDFEARRAEAQSVLVKDLETYVDWCHSKRLYDAKQKGLVLLLELQPDHAEARKTLGHVRDKQGGWKLPPEPKTFRDFDKKALAEEEPARWRAAKAGYLEVLRALVEEPAFTPEQRDEAARAVLRFEPDDERVHRALGEVRGEKGWVLPETLRAKEKREALRAEVRNALQRAEGQALPAPLVARERAFPLAFKAVAAPGLRVVGTVSEDELVLAAQAVLAVQHFAQSMLGSKYALPRELTVFLLADRAELPVFLEHHAAIPAEERALYLALESSGIARTVDFASWTSDTQRRIDGVVRLVLGFWISGAYQVTVQHGWAYEGFGLYLTRALVRTRLTWMAQPSSALDVKADMALRDKLIDPATNWMDESLRLLKEKRLPAFAELAKKDAGKLTTEDVLTAYTLATYLMEVRPEAVPVLLAGVGAGKSPVQHLQEALGQDLAAFQRHLERWLAERV